MHQRDGPQVNLNYSRDHSVDESLEYMVCDGLSLRTGSTPMAALTLAQVNWNAAMLQTDDIKDSIMSKTPTYSKL